MHRLASHNGRCVTSLVFWTCTSTSTSLSLLWLCTIISFFFFLIINWNWCVEYLELLWWINKTFLATRSSRGPFLFFNVYCMIYLHAITWFISICCSYILWLTLFAIRPAKEFLFRSNYNILLSQMLSVA